MLKLLISEESVETIVQYLTIYAANSINEVEVAEINTALAEIIQAEVMEGRYGNPPH